MDDPTFTARYPRNGSRAIDRVQEQVATTIEAARTLCIDNPAINQDVAALLERLEEIQNELDKMANQRSELKGGDLYPFWIRLAREGLR
jgi:hypothetical protein